MAIDIPVENDPVVSSKITTWRTELETPAGAASDQVYIRGHRQIVDTKQSGTTATRIAPNLDVTRRYDEIKDQQFTASGVTVTGEQLFALVGAAIDQFDNEDYEQQQEAKRQREEEAKRQREQQQQAKGKANGNNRR
jgi:hypothetical protein